MVGDVLRYAVAAILMVAAISKWATNTSGLARFIEGLGLRAQRAVLVVAVIPWIEMGAGVGLLFDLAFFRAGAFVLLVGFLLTQSLVAVKDSSRSCACFGAMDGKDMPARLSLARSVVLVVAGVGMMTLPSMGTHAGFAAFLVGLQCGLVTILAFSVVGRLGTVRKVRHTLRRLAAAATRTEGETVA